MVFLIIWVQGGFDVYVWLKAEDVAIRAPRAFGILLGSYPKEADGRATVLLLGVGFKATSQRCRRNR